MEWTTSNSSEDISERVTDKRNGESLISLLDVSDNRSRIHTVYYTCSILFRIQEKPSDTTADNIPTYNHTWTYKAGRLCFKLNSLLYKPDLDCAQVVSEFKSETKEKIKQMVGPS